MGCILAGRSCGGSSFWAGKGLNGICKVLSLCATSELWCAIQVQNGFEDLRSDHQAMKASVLSTKSDFISWALPCAGRTERNVRCCLRLQLSPTISNCVVELWKLDSLCGLWRPPPTTQTASSFTRWQRHLDPSWGRKLWEETEET